MKPFNVDETPIVLKTPRLTIIALDLENLYHYVHHYEVVHFNLEKTCAVFEHDPDIKYAFENAYYQATNDPERYFWYTSWEVVLMDSDVIIGGLCFKGPPDETGGLEVGYSIYDAFSGNGYATEGLEALLEWATKVHNIRKFTASVEPDNVKSKRVLEKLKFRCVPINGDVEWWLKEI